MKKNKFKRKLLIPSGEKKITKETELGIPLEELAIEMLPPKKPRTDIIKVIYNETSRVKEAVKIMAEQAILDEKLNIKNYFSKI